MITSSFLIHLKIIYILSYQYIYKGKKKNEGTEVRVVDAVIVLMLKKKKKKKKKKKLTEFFIKFLLFLSMTKTKQSPMKQALIEYRKLRNTAFKRDTAYSYLAEKYHLKQSFKPVEFDPEMLQRVCEEFVALAASVPRCEQYGDAVCEVCDRTAARLDEFTMFLDGIRDDEEAISAALPQIRARERDLEDAFAAIDSLFTFTRNMTETVMTLESRAAAIEDFFNSVKMKGMLKIVPLSFFSKKANSPDPVLPEWRPLEVPKSGPTIDLIKASKLLQEKTKPQPEQQSTQK